MACMYCTSKLLTLHSYSVIMRKKIFSFFFPVICLITGVALSASDPIDYGNFTPIFMTRTEMENAVKLEAPQPLHQTGKIYLYDKYILVNEKYKGIHVIDNSNPAQPVNVAFLHIDGCLDMAMKNNILYVDNAIDLLAISANETFTEVQVTKRLREIFPEAEAPDHYWSQSGLNRYRPENGILVRWEYKPQTY